MMKNIILVDIDHSIADAFWRDPMIGVASWDLYHAESINDPPAHDMVYFIRTLISATCFEFYGLTARPEKFRNLTTQWLLKNNIGFDDLLMRPNDDFRPAGEVKLSLCESCFGVDWKDKVLMMIDDNDKVIEAFKGEGITCLQVFNSRQKA
jgi:5'(3')-deoxyribonucleotidase